MTGDRDVEQIATLLATECVRTILTETRSEAMSASQLIDCCDASRPTVYRHLETLHELEFVTEAMRPDPQGHHRHVYSANLDQVTFDVSDDGIDISVRMSRRRNWMVAWL